MRNGWRLEECRALTVRERDHWVKTHQAWSHKAALTKKQQQE